MFTLPLMLLASAASQSDVPLIPAFFTGERLYQICSGPNDGHCWMYVAGVLDGIFEAESRASQPTICPAEITNRRAATQVTSYLRDNAEARSKAAAVAVKLALQSDLACTPAEDR